KSAFCLHFLINSFIFYLFIGERVSFLDHLRLEFLADYAPEYVSKNFRGLCTQRGLKLFLASIAVMNQ
ncbi:MAG: hypothetical protein PHU00_04695, partial [Bacteroidales bacterium]|nr:hypothetical protein [Bacteroidales bacterium]